MTMIATAGTELESGSKGRKEKLNPRGADGFFVLQRLLFPRLGPETELDLYFRPHGSVAFSDSNGAVQIEQGAMVSFGTYFNSFSLGKWHAAGALDDLLLDLRGSGRIEVKVLLYAPRAFHVIYCDLVQFGADGAARVDLSNYPAFGTEGVIVVEIRALGGPAWISGGSFLTTRSPKAWPRLAISITTFRREEAVGASATRLREFLRHSEFGRHIHVFIVDNGQSLDLSSSEEITIVPNPNLGGAGGFARGLNEAEAAGFTHCLFMDDDATCDMESIHRTYAFLALSSDPLTAVSGAMISSSRRWAMWENGAVFDGSCRPQFIGADLRRQDSVIAIENTTADKHYRQRHPTLYGGWWFFAFPIAQVKRYPFPFFVRGDDISFSLANDFRIVTLNGVVCFQDDFASKESPQTLYLDLRNHLVHHLVFDTLERSAFGTARIALWFILRSLVRFHYETAEAQLMAWNDVMKGPEFFARNADMTEQRARLKDITRTEIWQPAETLDLERKIRWSGRSHRWQRFFSIVLNGHLLPFWSRLGDRVVIDVDDRGLLFPIWGAAQITYVDPRLDRGYTVRLSMKKFFAIAPQVVKTAIRFMRSYAALKAEYQRGYPEIASRDFWKRMTG